MPEVATRQRSHSVVRNTAEADRPGARGYYAARALAPGEPLLLSAHCDRPRADEQTATLGELRASGMLQAKPQLSTPSSSTRSDGWRTSERALRQVARLMRKSGISSEGIDDVVLRVEFLALEG
jgi:hypothetical protein